jgi:anti-sigma-K factor RskA
MIASFIETIPLPLVAIPAVEFAHRDDAFPQWHPALLYVAIVVAVVVVVAVLVDRRRRLRKPLLSVRP